MHNKCISQLRSTSAQSPLPRFQSQLFLEITAISGEYPADNIHRIFSSSSYAKKKISALTTDKLIKAVNKGGIKGYRLTIGGKRRLMTDNPARFAGYLDGGVDTNKLRADHTRRLRLHSIAQTHTIMHNAGVEIFQDNKPKLFNKPPSVPCFYSSREQKSHNDNSGAIRGSRAIGTLLTPTQVYAVYNTGHAHANWREKVEQRYKAEVRGTICRGSPSEQYISKEVSGIMIGQTLEALEQYWVKGNKNGAGLSFLMNTYHPFYYITNDIYGEKQLELLCDDKKIIELKNALSKGLQPSDGKYPIEHDAFDEDGKPVLFCCMLNIPRLFRFHNGLSLQGKTGKIIAFDFQQEVLMRYMGDRVEFINISFEKFTTRFFPNEPN